MTVSEIAAASAVVLSVLSAVGNTLYVRGKLDAHAESATKRLDDFGETITRMDELSDTMRDRGVRVEEGLKRHEEECLRRQEAIDKRFDRLDRAGENLAAQMARMTPADIFAEVIPGRRVRPASDV